MGSARTGRAGQRAVNIEEIAFDVDFVHAHVLIRALLIAHVTSHFLAFQHTTGRLHAAHSDDSDGHWAHARAPPTHEPKRST